MDRLTRKELKSDKFALEVEHTVEYMAEHRRQVIRYSVAGVAVVLLVLGFFAWRRHQHNTRQQALATALEIQQAPVGQAQEGVRTYPTADARDKAAAAAFSDVVAKYSGSDEADIAQYYLGITAAGQGKLDQAEKQLREVANNGNRNYASLAKLALAEVLKSEGKLGDAEQVLRSLIARPTEFVSSEQATIALAQLIGPAKPAEARKLLEPLRADRGAISRAAIAALGQLPQK